MFSCPNDELGCSASFPLADCESHLTSCKFRPKSEATKLESVTCTSCGDLVQEEAMSMSKHLSLICPNKVVACTFTSIGCTQKIPRKLLKVILNIRILFDPPPPAGPSLQPDCAAHAAAGRETGQGAAVAAGNTVKSHFYHFTIICFYLGRASSDKHQSCPARR